MGLTKQAIEKNRITLVALLVIVMAGFSAYDSMPQNEDPGFIIRTAQILTFFPGASPERVELLVTDKLEKAIQEIPELDFVNSVSRTGVSEVYVNIIEREKIMRPIWDNVRRKVERASRELPEGIVGPIVNDEFGDVFGTVLTLTGEGYTYAELKDVADQVRNELLRIREVAKVDIHGVQEERIFVEYNNARLAELGLSTIQLKNLLAAQNILLPGGSVSTGDERIGLEPTGNFESVEDLRRALISLPGRSEMVYLEDIAEVTRGYIDPARSKVRASNVDALALGISLREGGNLIDLGNAVKETLARLQERYPIGLEFDVIAFQPRIVEEKVDAFVSNLFQAVAIVIVVMLVSLGFRTGMVVSSLIPMTMVMSIWMMSLFHIGLDQMSLSALIIALGLLVDNAIVMSESILVRMGKGEDATSAAVASADELRIPLLIASLTTAAAFLPIYLAESTVGEYTAPLFEVVSIALLCSWALSMTMVPMLSVQFMKVKKKGTQDNMDSKWYVGYRSLLLSALRRPILSLAVTFGIFMCAMYAFDWVPKIFFPAKDEPTLTAEFKLPIGSPIERTEAIAREVDEFITEDLLVNKDRAEGVLNWATFIGQGPPKFSLPFNSKPPTPHYFVMLINATSYPTALELIAKLERYSLENFPDVKPDVRSLMNGPPVASPVEIRISGEDSDEVFKIVDRLKTWLAAQSGTKNISDNWGRRTKKLVVDIDQARARRAGVSSQDIAVSLQTVLSGFETTQYREKEDVIPVTLRSVAADRKDVGKLESLNVFAQGSGQSVPLRQVANIDVVWEPAQILRRGRLKTVTVAANLDPNFTALDVFATLQVWLDKEQTKWPVGYQYEFGGEYEASVEGNQSIGEKLPIAGLIILLLLVGQFNSLRRPLIILMTIPLGFVGVVFGLLVAGSYFGFITLLGVISLAGIVINNAIVLLDRVNIEITNGLSPAQAVLEAAQRRLRPIILTTLTTVGGMLPLWYGGGPMFEPMAVAIIFGLLFATALTLLFVPIMYALFFRVSFKEIK
jgi:multidrug efflux pump